MGWLHESRQSKRRRQLVPSALLAPFACLFIIKLSQLIRCRRESISLRAASVLSYKPSRFSLLLASARRHAAASPSSSVRCFYAYAVHLRPRHAWVVVRCRGFVSRPGSDGDRDAEANRYGCRDSLDSALLRARRCGSHCIDPRPNAVECDASARPVVKRTESVDGRASSSAGFTCRSLVNAAIGSKCESTSRVWLASYGCSR